MKKWQLSKKKMLGFLTAGAIVVTMAGSYAVWDQLSDSASGTVTLRNKIEVAAPTNRLRIRRQILNGERHLYIKVPRLILRQQAYQLVRKQH